MNEQQPEVEINALEYTRKIYNRFAQQYHEHVSKRVNIWHKYIEKPVMTKLLKEICRGQSVLDLGCGSGAFTRQIQEFGARRVVGIDLSEELIKLANKENPELEFYVGDARSTPFNRSTFGVVSSSFVAHYAMWK